MVTGRLRSRIRASPRIAALYRGIRGFVLGPGSTVSVARRQPPIEDTVRQLHHVSPVASMRPEVRLNLIVPAVDGARTFGGIRTALDLFEAIGADGVERRIVSFKPLPADVADVTPGYRPVDAGEDPEIPLQVTSLDPTSGTIAVRHRDIFVATFWTTAELVGRVRRWQAATYGSAPERSGYVIQDFEPGFYPLSAQWLLARATYDDPGGTVAIFNTPDLRDYFHGAGIRFEDEFAFEPRILPALRAAMSRPRVARSRTIVVYGRPGTPRNAFPAIVDGLRAWRATDDRAEAWEVVSIGRLHPDVELGGGSPMRSLGKLDLEAYASLLRSASIGVSLMVSPHPSYPPLEMAHLGMLVLTNRFGAKDLATWHTNIATIGDVSAEAIAAALSALCRRYEDDPAVGEMGQPLRAAFISDEPPFAIAADVVARLLSGLPETG